MAGFKQDLFVAIGPLNGTDSAGSGTWNDPFTGPEDNPRGKGGDWFDTVLQKHSRPNQTVRIGPGIFRTAGWRSWKIKSGMRLVGSGTNSTTLRLAQQTGSFNYAIGADFSGPPINGFEASDFLIDLDFNNEPATGVGAIAVFGTHILLRRLRIFNYGASTNGIAAVINAAAAGTENCVVDSVVIESPAGSVGANTQCVLFHFGGSRANPHNFCVIRNCVGRGTSAAPTPPAKVPERIFGIVPGAGRGTILEANQFIDLTVGVSDLGSPQSPIDLVIRDNYFRNVARGIELTRPAGAVAVGRVVATDNIIEVGTNLPNPTGIRLASTGGTYANAILRKNIIRDARWDLTPAPADLLTGIYASQVTDLNVESNLITNAASGSRVLVAKCASSKLYNNVTTGGITVPP